jgi:hypothetical protein
MAYRCTASNRYIVRNHDCHKRVAGLRGYGASDTLAHGLTYVSRHRILISLSPQTREQRQLALAALRTIFGHAGAALLNRGVS